MPSRVRTLVFVHAHPDDEALLTAGTMARAAAEGHRVVLVVATDGAAGLTSTALASDLGTTRLRELHDSARALGVAQVHLLGFADSGLDGEVAGGFAQQPVQVVAGSIATICDHVGADVLIGYDPRGGYGHPDHVQIHRSTRAAAGTCVRRPRLFEATLPREPIAGAVRLAARLRLTPDDFDPAAFDRSWTPRAQITHRVDVRRYIAAKDASLRAHGSQATSNSTMRTLGVLTRLPGPVQSILLGTEYYVAVPSPPAIPATVSTSPESS